MTDVTVLVSTYNHAAYIEAALESVLSQACAPMEVLVSDDCSADDTWDKVSRIAEAYSGPHRLRIHRQPENVGGISNNRWLRQNASSDWLITNDGDDISLPGRLARIREVIGSRGVRFVASNAILFDGDGQRQGQYLPDVNDRTFTLGDLCSHGYTQHLLGATTAFHRSVLTTFGFFEPSRIAGGGGDHIIPFRAAFLGEVYYIGQPLHGYRQHATQETRTIADRTQSTLVYQETMCAYLLKTCIHQWEDARLWLRLHPEDKRGRGAANIVLVRLLGQLKTWNLLRNRLLMAGLRPTWCPREELDRVMVSDPFQPVGAPPAEMS